jgi:hypothetical protein
VAPDPNDEVEVAIPIEVRRRHLMSLAPDRQLDP